MAANADMNGADAVGQLQNFRASIEKERNAADTWWANWGFLAKTEGVLPNNRSEYIKGMEEKYKKMAAGKPTPGFSTTNDLLGVGQPLEFGSKYPVRRNQEIQPTNPFY